MAQAQQANANTLRFAEMLGNEDEQTCLRFLNAHRDIDVNYVDAEGHSLFFIAGNNYETIKIQLKLIERGAVPRSIDDILDRNNDMVQWLDIPKADAIKYIDEILTRNFAPIGAVLQNVLYWSGDKIIPLLEHLKTKPGFDINEPYERETPLYYFVKDNADIYEWRGSYIKIIRLLVSWGADPEKVSPASGQSPKQLAAGHDDKKVLKIFRDAAAGQGAPAAAPAPGRSLEEQLLEEMKKAQPDLAKIREWAPQVGIQKSFKGGETLLFKALQHPNIDVVELLLNLGADPATDKGQGQIFYYVGNHEKALDMLKLMVARGLKMPRLTRHLEAIIRGKPLEYIEYVIHQAKNYINEASSITEGIDINGRNSNYYLTPLMYICTLHSADPVKQNKYKAVMDMLFMNGADPNIKTQYNMTALHLALLYFTKGSPVRYIYKLLDNGASPNIHLQYKDAFFRLKIAGLPMPTGFLSPLCIAFVLGNEDIFKRLLEKGADVNGKINAFEIPDLLTFAAEILSHEYSNSDKHRKLFDELLAVPTLQISEDVAQDAEEGKKYSKIVNEKILAKVVRVNTMWKGWTRSDLEKFDLLFTEEGAKAYSCCPVCLKYVARQDGCLYMHHDCSKLPGFYHKALYEKYKAPNGEVEWCTVCGRICKQHRHYKVDLASNPVPDFSAPEPTDHAVFFQNDCRGANGGGGLPEKIERVRALRQFARELQDVVGEIPQRKALEQLTEATWNAPAASFYGRRAEKIMTTKKWNFETANAFPANVLPAAQAANAPVPNIPRPAANVGLLPTFAAEGENVVAMNDGIPVVYFHHRLPNGQVKDHRTDGEGVGLPTLLNYVQDMVRNFGAAEFGACPFQCGATLHPDEVAKAFELLGDPQAALVAEYKAKYNQRFRRQAGGRVGGARTRKGRNKRTVTRRVH